MPLSRRDILKVTGLAAVGVLAGGAVGAPAAPSAPARRTRALRIAHLTDIHVEPERHAGDGMAACLAHLRENKEAPDLLITGGDHVYDSGGTDEARTRTQWDLFAKVLKDGCALPRLSVLGNHDCWGWDKKNSKTTGDEARWGKKWALDALGMSARYHSTDRGGWHIVCLDSIQPAGDGYLGKIDDEQFEWLAGDLAAVKPATPVLVVSHIPILAACIFFNNGDARAEQVAPARMHTDAGRLKTLFLKHPNVKVAISGHIHLLDRVDYDGVTYLCNGAVCGNWWKGRHQECDEGYTLLDLFDDGTFERQYVTYGWKAQGK